MKKILCSLAFFAALTISNAQTVLFEDDFEFQIPFTIDDGIENWLMYDMDGSPLYTDEGTDYENSGGPFAYIIFDPVLAGATNSTSGEHRNYDPHSGTQYLASWAAVMPADGGTGPNNDWAISPAVTLGASGNVLEFWVKSMSDTYGLETYSYHIFNEDFDDPFPDDFTLLGSGTAPYPDWEQVVVNLDDYAGQTVRIAIQCTSADAYMFMVDDFRITTQDGMGTVDLNTAGGLSVYPNPALQSFNLNLPANFDKNNLKVTITNIAGQTMKTFSGVDAYDISNLPKGIYLVKATDGKYTETTKLLKR
ncbi:MAG: choice-of-anchor J domain-containing protein [Weeksellaceae bacterium]